LGNSEVDGGLDDSRNYAHFHFILSPFSIELKLLLLREEKLLDSREEEKYKKKYFN
jgi:hypothetical protein